MQLTYDGAAPALSDAGASEPIFTIEHNGVMITVLGTAHVSKASADKVRELLCSGDYDSVALELCPNRYQALIDPEAITRLDLLQVIRQGKGAMVTASLALGAFQQRIAKQLDVQPGAEMKVAIEFANKLNLPIALIDRDIGITLKRIYRNVPFFRRLKVLSGLIASVIAHRTVSEGEIEELKQGDMLEATFNQFAESAPDIYLPLVDERDRYMVARLFENAVRSDCRRMLVVVGAGHLKGMIKYSDSMNSAYVTDPEKTLADLDGVPAASKVIKLLPWLIVAAILSGFILGFSQSADLGWQMLQQWVLINGSLAAIGALMAAAHPMTVLSAFIAAPLTSLNPTVSAGVAAVIVESWFRKPKMGDFAQLREDTSSLKGWWGNRVARTLLVFLFTGVGSAIGTYIAGYNIFASLS